MSFTSRSVEGAELGTLSLEGFLAITWTGFAICSIACTLRLYVRRKCFGRFLTDDWIMLFALADMLTVAILAQIYIPDVYATTKYVDAPSKDVDYLNHFRRGLRGSGAATIVMYIGVWAVKVSFLLFFKRFGAEVKEYIVAWYIVFAITLGCGAVSLGVQQYRCRFASSVEMVTRCGRPSDLNHFKDTYKVSWIVDVVSDILIICFPVAILWRVRISLKQKLILTCVFSLVLLTIAVTIVRGTIVNGQYKSVKKFSHTQLQMTWIWLFIEYCVSFLVACMVSFRALFTRTHNHPHERRPQLPQTARHEQQYPAKTGVFAQVIRAHNSLFESFRELETSNEVRLPSNSSGTFSSPFPDDVENCDIPNAQRAPGIQLDGSSQTSKVVSEHSKSAV